MPQHEVWIEDAVPPTPLSFQPVKTNEQGRAVFDRLAAGRYRVWTKTVDRCAGRVELTISRLVAVGGRGDRAGEAGDRRPRRIPDHLDARSRGREGVSCRPMRRGSRRGSRGC